MSVLSDGNADGPGESEVGHLDGPVRVDQQVLRLEVTMQHSTLVAETDRLADLSRTTND